MRVDGQVHGVAAVGTKPGYDAIRVTTEVVVAPVVVVVRMVLGDAAPVAVVGITADITVLTHDAVRGAHTTRAVVARAVRAALGHGRRGQDQHHGDDQTQDNDVNERVLAHPCISLPGDGVGNTHESGCSIERLTISYHMV